MTGSEISSSISEPRISSRFKSAKDYEKKLLKKTTSKKGRILGDFKYAGITKLDSLLGGGVFGITYRMINSLDLNEYAVKHVDIKAVQNILLMINPHKEKFTKSDTLNFILNEARILVSVNHPNIVRYSHTLSSKANVYMCMEYVRGGTLESAIDSNRFTSNNEEILSIVYQMLLGLGHLHEKNILHRDLKADNIFLSNDASPVVKLGDLGMSRVLENPTGMYCQSKGVYGVGHRFYRSPESLLGKKYGTPDDIWALGIIILELMSGSILHKTITDADNFAFVNVNEYVEQITTDYNKYSELSHLVKKMLIKKSSNRITVKNAIIDVLQKKNVTNVKNVACKLFINFPVQLNHSIDIPLRNTLKQKITSLVNKLNALPKTPTTSTTEMTPSRRHTISGLILPKTPMTEMALSRRRTISALILPKTPTTPTTSTTEMVPSRRRTISALILPKIAMISPT